jgi:hypothetical protein
LAGLLIARFLKLPLEATYTDTVMRLSRVLTRDGFIEDLSWKYLVWFYNQVDRVYVSSVETLRDLEDKGVASDKLRLYAPASMDLRVSANPAKQSRMKWR